MSVNSAIVNNLFNVDGTDMTSSNIIKVVLDVSASSLMPRDSNRSRNFLDVIMVSIFAFETAECKLWMGAV